MTEIGLNEAERNQLRTRRWANDCRRIVSPFCFATVVFHLFLATPPLSTFLQPPLSTAVCSFWCQQHRGSTRHQGDDKGKELNWGGVRRGDNSETDRKKKERALMKLRITVMIGGGNNIKRMRMKLHGWPLHSLFIFLQMSMNVARMRAWEKERERRGQ